MKLKLGTRIGIGYGVVITALVLVLAIAFLAFETAHRETMLIRNRLSPSIEATNNLILALERMENTEFLLFVPGLDRKLLYQHYDSAEKDFRRWYLQLEVHAEAPEGRELVAQIGHDFGAFRQSNRQLRELLGAGKVEEARHLNANESLTLANSLRDSARSFRDMNLRAVQKAQDREISVMRLAENLAVLVALFAVALSGLIWWRTSRAIVSPLQALQNATSQIAEGKFVTSRHPESPRTMEIATLEANFNRMSQRLQTAAQQLLEANSTLEAQVADRTLALRESNEVLQRSLEELRTLDKLKSDFMAVMSHELLTPINFITGFGSALEDQVLGPLAPEQERAIRRIMEGAQRLTRMVRNVLDYTKLESGELTILAGTIDYEELLRRVAAVIRPQAEARHQQFEVNLATPLQTVWADSERVEQVLIELLDNALKFTADGGRIRLSAWNSDDGVVTEVSDTGIGISQSALPHLFKAFSQGDSSSTRAYGGMGLGLAIVSNLVMRMGGTLTVQSALAQGSTFRFTLPRAQ
ncbi:Autoinducer 2 sensor kinase/phosphatase LuxQ [compost metagenome]